MTNNKDKQDLEIKISELLSKGKTKSFITLKFGNTKFMYDGDLRSFADFLDDSGLNKLKVIKETNGTWYDWDDKNKQLEGSLNKKVSFIEDEVELAFDISLETSKIYKESDALKLEALQNKYKKLYTVEKKESESLPI